MGQTLLILAALQLKHLLADYFFQTNYMVLNKGKYGHLGGLLHSGLHVAFSLAVLLVAGVPLGVVALLCGAEFIVHYHIDWGKEAIGKHFVLSPDTINFWRLHGADQALHQLTYLGMITWLAVVGFLSA